MGEGSTNNFSRTVEDVRQNGGKSSIIETCVVEGKGKEVLTFVGFREGLRPWNEEYVGRLYIRFNWRREKFNRSESVRK